MNIRINQKASVTFAAFALLMNGLLLAQTLTVGSGPSYDFSTIQVAIDKAVSGDEIVVAKGKYYENIDFKGKNIVLRSTDPNNPDVVTTTIIDGKRKGSAVTFRNGEEPNCVLSGFTITNGYATYGGGICCSEGSPTLANCIFERNYASEQGGGIYNCRGRCRSRARLVNCVFTNNSASKYGGGMCNVDTNLTLRNCTFAGNSTGMAGGGMFNSNSGLRIINCTFGGNLAHGLMDRTGRYIPGKGGAIYNGDATATLSNCIIWSNIAAQGDEIHLSALVGYGGQRYPSSIRVSYSDVEGGSSEIYIEPDCTLDWGEGNINADPCFAQPGCWDPNGTPQDANDDFWVDGDYHLKSQAGRWDANEGRWTKDEVTSPCIDAGDPTSPIGYEPFPNGGIVNMGAYGGAAEASKSYFGEPVCETIFAGDISGDCKVDFKDFALMATHWVWDNHSLQLPEFYYYSSGHKIYLDLYTEMIAVWFEEIVNGKTVSAEEKESLIEADPVLEKISIEAPDFGLVLIATNEGSDEIDIIQTIERLDKSPLVKYSMPVFGDSDNMLIVMDDFFAKFTQGVTEQEIESFNKLHNVEVIEQYPWGAYLLRVKEPKNINALEMANLYYEDPITEYAVPNFLTLCKNCLP